VGNWPIWQCEHFEVGHELSSMAGYSRMCRTPTLMPAKPAFKDWNDNGRLAQPAPFLPWPRSRGCRSMTATTGWGGGVDQITQIEYCRNFIFKRHFPIHKVFERGCGLWRLTANRVSEIFGVRFTKETARQTRHRYRADRSRPPTSFGPTLKAPCSGSTKSFPASCAMNFCPTT